MSETITSARGVGAYANIKQQTHRVTALVRAPCCFANPSFRWVAVVAAVAAGLLCGRAHHLARGKLACCPFRQAASEQTYFFGFFGGFGAALLAALLVPLLEAVREVLCTGLLSLSSGAMMATQPKQVVPDISHYQTSKPDIRDLMLSDARELVEATWRGAESLDGRASSLLAATGGLGAASLAGLAIGLSEGMPELASGSAVSLAVFVAGSALAAWLSKGQTLLPVCFSAHVIARDSANGKSRDEICLELARMCDTHFEKNQTANADRSRLLSWTAYTIPGGLVLGIAAAILVYSGLIDPGFSQPDVTPPAAF